MTETICKKERNKKNNFQTNWTIFELPVFSAKELRMYKYTVCPLRLFKVAHMYIFKLTFVITVSIYKIE